MALKKRIGYKDAGVNIDEADRAVAFIRKRARSTFTRGVLTDIGSFGGGYLLSGWKKPVLVSSADGVGTKLKIAFLTGRHDTIGEDLVNHCVNDIAVQGAVPLFFLDYFAVGKLDAAVADQVIAGVARGCRNNGCALIGGETAEMPGLYQAGEYDLAGFIVGAVEQKQMLTGKRIRTGDVLLGLPSNGLHTNGYSLARKLLFEVGGCRLDEPVSAPLARGTRNASACQRTRWVEEESSSRRSRSGTNASERVGPGNASKPRGATSPSEPRASASVMREGTLGDELLRVHRSYLKPMRALIDEGVLKGAAHITGGGITDNTPRILPKGLAARIDVSAWKIPAIFETLREIGNIDIADYRRTFNLGIGMILVISKRNLGKARGILAGLGENHFEIGAVVESKGARVTYVGNGVND